MLEAKGKKLSYSKTLWADHGGVRVKEGKETITVEGVDEDSFVKIFSHFGRVLKLYTFENGGWVDVETGAVPTDFDESMAGTVIPAPLAKDAKKAKKAPPSRAAPARPPGQGATPPKARVGAAAKKTKSASASKAKSPKTGAAKAAAKNSRSSVAAKPSAKEKPAGHKKKPGRK